MSYRVGYSITRLNFNSRTPVSVTSGHADFVTKDEAAMYSDAMGLAHEQDNYDVRTWTTYFSDATPFEGS